MKPIFPMHKATETCIFLTSHEISVGVIGLHNDNAKGGNVSGHSDEAAGLSYFPTKKKNVQTCSGLFTVP